MRANTAVCAINLGLIALVAAALYWTGSMWAFVGLIFLASTKMRAIETTCPKCGQSFIAQPKTEGEPG